MKRPLKTPASSTWQKVNSNGVNTLMTDLKVALTFVGIAETHEDESTIKRNVDNARTAFDTMTRFRVRFSFSPDQTREFDTGMEELKRRLEALGQVF